MIIFRNSVIFQTNSEREDTIKGIDITGPPSLPRPFLVREGGEGDIIVDSEDEKGDEESADELNTARIEDEEDTVAVDAFGDNL